MLAQSSPPSQFKDKQSEIDIPTEEQLFKDDPDPVVLSAQIAVRLKKIQQTISLDYNDHVQKYISYNTHEKRKTHIAKMLGRAKKFFPIFEPILAKYGIPDEMKYLAVVESALNPFALSKAGASGPWQFMYSTALRYNLSINKRVDERRDPYLACDAAARYLLEMYNLYGNWQLSIASYNCGAGNVNKAIKKAGGSTNFWDIRSFLPAETRAYVPSFIAMVYAMKYADRYGIDAQELGNEKTHRITVRQKVTLNDLENTLTIPRQILIDDNPSLLTTSIPSDFILNLPISKINAFNNLQDSLYQKALCEQEEQQLESPIIGTKMTASFETKNELKQDKTTKPSSATSTTKGEKWKEIPATNEKELPIAASAKMKLKEDDVNYKTIAYTVKKGDNLGAISAWFHCTVKDLKRWNSISDNTIKLNDELLVYVHKTDVKKFTRFNYLSKNIKDDLSSKISTFEESAAAKLIKDQKAKEPFIDKINPSMILKNKDCFKTHIVKKGESVYGIAQKYEEVTVQDIIAWNGLKKNPILQLGDKLKVRKIPCK
ncbi:MAG TPA: transglycosylase SLT domain-containing protein [Chitinophagales bacterium]|jgi:membrane-bound lytic murein transglycosylase D|nr:transglycosylase SLT domain-containing protein [Chitinophagales bacterium]MBP6153613.1 transglycosylase SLT domain-containing protein [Chitinophagales bacterium]HQV77888.1 transglycosylase SLT domain-containing protein [Chitinophagales bacterium]HQW78609.1 transglycosylase SLT domain-containing protein [Chitinophagales bacterium]HRB66487.1 transglycosylase SLT domain-containing protein [Chitinophagales bacterium]